MDILEKISKAIVEMDEDSIEELLDCALSEGVSLDSIYKEGLNQGMLQATKLFESKEYYVPEMIVCADTLNKGVQYIKKHGDLETGQGPTLVIGVVQGDMHEIGKNIVKIMLEAADFNVIDLGVNVSCEDFVHAAIENKASVIGMSSMMTTTMGHMGELVVKLKSQNLENPPKVIIGGGCISANYAKEICADGYSKDAIEAVKLINNLLGE